jgi:hypothetical protein
MSILSDKLEDAIELITSSYDVICFKDGLSHLLHELSDEDRKCCAEVLMIALLLDIRSRL